MRMRFLLGVLISVGVVILAVILIIKVLTGPSRPPAKPLVNYSNTSTTMQLLIDGPVVADQLHQAIQITVGGNGNQIEIFKGYQFDVTSSKSYESNPSAYAAFLRAIDLAGYSKGNSGDTDYRGVCPLGERYVFQVVSGSGQTIKSYWSTSCGNIGNFKGNTNLIMQLFENQIPDYNKFTTDVNFLH